MKRRYSNLPAYGLLLAALIGGSLLTGCGDSGSTTQTSEQQSKLYVSLTDAEGDFTQYTVDVTALKLYRASGAGIETLPNTTTLDFAQYVDVTEFLSSATVPVGVYTKAEITLDYSQSVISVEDENGNSIPATAVDNDGNALGTVTLSTLINSSEGFVIHYGQPASLTLDFDLEASNQVVIDPMGDSATVTVNPVLVANTSIDDEKTRRVRGLLAEVDTDQQTFDIDIRPFRIRNHSYGVISVHTDEATLYEIDGQSYGPDSGLAVLADLDLLSPVVVLGQYDYTQRQYLATQVYAGSSVPWGNRDVLKGSVIARSGNTLTVLGATIELDDGHFQFNDEVTVQIDDTTRVNKQGTSQAVSIADISIGQQVSILGDMTDDENMDASGETGIVRMRYSDIAGTVISASPLQLKLQHINRRNVIRYDFSGSGIDMDNDADPEQYEVDTGALALDTLEIDAPVWIRGFPTAFGSAPQDFSAKTLVNVSQGVTKMAMSYGRHGSPTAVISLDDSGLLLDLESTVVIHHLKQAGIITDIADLTAVPLIQPNDGEALYAINQGRSLDVFTEWSRFQDALSTLLDNGHKLVYVHSKGLYNPAGPVISSRHLLVRVTDSSVTG